MHIQMIEKIKGILRIIFFATIFQSFEGYYYVIDITLLQKCFTNNDFVKNDFNIMNILNFNKSNFYSSYIIKQRQF